MESNAVWDGCMLAGVVYPCLVLTLQFIETKMDERCLKGNVGTA